MSVRREQTVQRMLDGAAAAFVKAGYAATSMEDIAAAAGVSKLLLYRDFAGKRELYQAVLERTQARIEAAVPIEASDLALVALMGAARADPDGFTLLFRHAAREPDFAGYAETLIRRHEEAAGEIMREIEPDPALRRWAAQVAARNTYQMIIAWLELGDAAQDAEAIRRIREAGRAVSVPFGRPRKGSTR